MNLIFAQLEVLSAVFFNFIYIALCKDVKNYIIFEDTLKKYH